MRMPKKKVTRIDMANIFWLVSLGLMLVSLGLMCVVSILLTINAIYINNSIPTLTGWELIDKGKLNLQKVADKNCYREADRHYEFVIGNTPLNTWYPLYTPLPLWNGYETVTYDQMSILNSFKLYKHFSLIPFWTDYLIICGN